MTSLTLPPHPLQTLRTAPTTAAIAVLRLYQRLLSPLFGALGAQCRFEPSCSQYAIDAVQQRGPLRGFALALWRILRCNPFHPGGYDPATPAAAPSTAEPS